jgi:peptidyl-prolyl cis-trans isomerase C
LSLEASVGLRLVPLLALLALGACSSPPADPERTAAPATPAPRADIPAPADAPEAAETIPEAARDDRPAVAPVPRHLPAVVARVNGAEVSRVEFEDVIRGVEASIGSEVPPEERDRVYREMLDELITLRLLVQEATRRVTVADAEVDATVQEIRRQFASQDEFQQMLRAEGLTLDRLRENLRIELAVAKLIDEEIGGRVRPSGDDVAAYYRENREQFRHARVRASHILLPVPSYADAGARLRARQQAEAIVAQLRAGADFAALARQHSQDPGSAARGGDLGYFEWGEMVEPLNEAAFRLQPQSEVDILEGPRGYHVLVVTDRQPTDRVASLQEVRPTIEDLLEATNRQRETDAFITALREKSQVQIYF